MKITRYYKGYKCENKRIEYRRIVDPVEHSSFPPGKSEICKERESCELDYCDPEECPYFDPGPETNARRIRAMISTDEGLAKVLMELGDKGVYIPFCKGKSECLELLEIDAIPESKCMECLLDWMRQPVEREDQQWLRNRKSTVLLLMRQRRTQPD